MNFRLQSLFFVATVVASLGLAHAVRIDSGNFRLIKQKSAVQKSPVSVYGASISETTPTVKTALARDWKVLDPKISSEAVFVQLLDENFPLYHYNTYATWKTASLLKLLSSAVVIENLSLSENILITEKAIAEEENAGDLKSGEIYNTKDLLKIMLLTSSNDAAAALEDRLGGRNEFARLLNKKAREIGMSRSLFYDASGLSDLNLSTAGDLSRLVRYVLLRHPKIFQWTQTPSFLVQPVNGTENRMVKNINPLVKNSDFLGGKTGTSPKAKENLIALFSLDGKRVLMIILGGRNRFDEADMLLKWVKEAYHL